VAHFIVHANLDCEARWAGIALPAKVRDRISLLGALVAALAPADAEIELWTPAPFERSRVALALAETRVGVPARCDLAWADADAKAANDRRLALALAERRGVALPGAKVIARVDEIDIAGPWVVKAPWTAAGRDRCHGEGAPTHEQRTRVGRLLAMAGALVLEPWCDRIVDAGVCATVTADGMVSAHPAHGLITDRRGGFLGIDLAPPALEPAERDLLATMVAAAGALLAEHGYAGPFAVDAFAYRDPSGARRFQPLSEINARFSFGWIARALAQRTSASRLGFAEPPAGATTLIAPADDRVTAWLARTGTEGFSAR
jgi:hypothetical protein